MGDLALSSLATDARSQSDLEWYFQRAESELGIRSNFDILSHQLLSGGSPTTGSKGDSLVDERRIEAVHRMRAIRRVLIEIDSASQRVLAAAYEPRAWGPEVRRLFRTPITGVAFYLFGDLQELIQKQKKDVVRGQVAQAEKHFTRACQSFADQRAEQRLAKRAAA
jgi:hypothetical protein